MKKHLLLCLLCFWAIAANAQTNECGTTFNSSEYEQYIRKNRTLLRANSQSNSDVIYFPIQYHIIRNSNGIMALSVDGTKNMTKMLNEAYKNANIQFYSCSNVDIITNNNYFNYKYSLESEIANYDNPNAINVYLCNTINNGSIAGYSHFPWTAGNRIFIAKDYANLSTVPHEFGHYFGLLHTHETAYGKEKVDGSNCETAGDKLCDTPADPGLSYNTVDCNCNYIGHQYLDGLPYSPSTINIMSYSRKECRTQFTSAQIAVIQKYAKNERYYLVDTKSVNNRTITKNETYCNDIIEVKNTKVKSGGKLIIDFCESATIDGPFEVELGATLEIK